MSFKTRSALAKVPLALVLATAAVPALADTETFDCGGTIYRVDYQASSVARRDANGQFGESMAAQISETQVRFREGRGPNDKPYNVVIDRTSGSMSSTNQGAAADSAACKPWSEPAKS